MSSKRVERVPSSGIDLVQSAHYGIGCAKEEYTGVQLEGGNLARTIFFRSKFSDCDFTGVDFSHCDFEDAIFENCNFIGCALDHVSFNDVEMEETNFYKCTLDKTDFGGAALIGSSFTECEGKGVCFWRTQLDVIFMACLFPDVDFKGADIKEGYFGQCEIPRAQFNDSTVLTGTQFEKTDLTDTYIVQSPHFNPDNLRECTIFPFKLHLNLETVNALYKKGVERMSKGVDHSIYGHNTKAHLYCSNLDIYRKFKR